MWFRVDRSVAAQLWQWARREIGGRWVTQAEYIGGFDDGPWVRIAECQATLDRIPQEEIERMSPLWLFFARRHNAQIDQCASGCKCEVYQ